MKKRAFTPKTVGISPHSQKSDAEDTSFPDFENIIATMPNYVYWLDRNCIVLGGNDNFAHMLGLSSRDQLVGLNYDQIATLAHWTKEQREIFKKSELEVMSTGVPQFNLEEVSVVIDGKTKYFMSSRVPICNTKKDILGILSVFTDITDRKQDEITLKDEKEKIESANKEKTHFLENMRHDIRTPLIGITSCANILKEEINDLKVKKHVDHLVISSYALVDLLNEILELIKTNSHDLPTLKKKFDLKKKLSDVIQLNQAKASYKHLDLTLEYDDAIPHHLIGDSTRIHRIALELITNALNFTDKGSVKLIAQLAKLTERDVIIKLVIEDTGIGMLLNQQQEIFLQFKPFPLKKTGVMLVKQFLDDIQGEIYVESKISMGTKVTCLIPLKKPLLDDEYGCEATTAITTKLLNVVSSNSAPVLIQESASSLSRTRILIIEDSSLAAMVAKELLSKLDCQADVAANGGVAIELMHAHHYDLIFVDIELPDIDGYEVTKCIRSYELSKGAVHVPIVALTAHVDDENKQKCVDAGMNAILSKPLVKEKVADILKAFILYRKKPQETAPMIQEPHDQSDHRKVSIKGRIIDIESAKQILGYNEDALYRMLEMLRDNLADEIINLQSAYEKEDWLKVQTITYRIQGSCTYCGAVRLKEACARLEASIKNNKTETMMSLYAQMINEIQIVRQAIADKNYYLAHSS